MVSHAWLDMSSTSQTRLAIPASEPSHECIAPRRLPAQYAVEMRSLRGEADCRFGVTDLPSVLGAMRSRAPSLHERLRAAWEGPALLPTSHWPRGASAVALALAALPSLKRDGIEKLDWDDLAEEGASVGHDFDWRICVPEALQDAGCKRLRSFMAGRLCAEEAIRRRRALSEPLHESGPVGQLETSIGMGQSGAPVWPLIGGQRLVGSITHSDRWAVAVVCPSTSIRCIGIDCEESMDAQSHAAVLQLCFTHEEHRRFPVLSTDATLASVVFSAKEALYKAVWPILGRYVDFKEVQVLALDSVAGTLGFESSSDDLDALLRGHWTHRFLLQEGCVHTVSALSTDESPDGRFAGAAGCQSSRRTLDSMFQSHLKEKR